MKRTDGTRPTQDILDPSAMGPDEVWTDRAYICGPRYDDESVCRPSRRTPHGGGSEAGGLRPLRRVKGDGVRRIQEQITRPLERLLEYEEDTFSFTSSQPAGGTAANDEPLTCRRPRSGQGEARGLRPLRHVKGTDRAYIYGPGYVDEFVCRPLTRREPRSGLAAMPPWTSSIASHQGQVDRYGNVVHMLQDANYP